MFFIKLTYNTDGINKKKFYVNPEHISTMRTIKYGDITCTVITIGKVLSEVEETPDQIISLINADRF